MTEQKFIWGKTPKNIQETKSTDVIPFAEDRDNHAYKKVDSSPETPNIVKGIVLSVENKTSRKSGHPYFELILEDKEGKYFGIKFSGRGISPYNVQDEAEFTYEINGQYYNIRDYLNRKEMNTKLNGYDKDKFNVLFKDGMLDKLSKSLLLYVALEIIKMKKGQIDELFVEYKKLEEYVSK
jgi:hypothetical protein